MSNVNTFWTCNNSTDLLLYHRAKLVGLGLCVQLQYFGYVGGDLEVFHPMGMTRCTDGVKFHPYRKSTPPHQILYGWAMCPRN